MYKKSYMVIFILYGYNSYFTCGGMSLKTVRFIQWLLGALLLVYGIYLIFGVQEFFGMLAIIAAFFIFPSVGKRRKRSYSHDYSNNYDNDSHSSNDASDSDGGGDSGGDSGGGGD
jgi:hypothetical protein